MAPAVVERLAPPAAGLMTLLGMAPNPATNRLSEFLETTDLSLVSRAFQQHNLHGMQRELREIRMTGEASVRLLRATEDALPPNVRPVDELAQAITTKLINSPFLNAPNSAALKRRLQAIWWRCEDLRRSLTQEEADRTGPLWQSRLHAFNEKLAAAELSEAERNFDAQPLEELCLRLRVMHRANQVIQTQGFDIEDRAQIARCFSALHASQKAAASAYAAGDQPFANALAQQPRAAFSLKRFLDLENAIMRVEMVQRARNLRKLWNNIQHHAINFGPNPPRTPFEKSVWLRDPTNAPELAQRGFYFLLRNISGIPDEIDAFPDTRFVEVDDRQALPAQRLRTLPNSFGNLSQIDGLRLYGCDLREIPRALETVPRLQIFIIQENAHPIRIFPEGVARQHFSGIYYLFEEAMDGLSRLTLGVPADGAKHFAWLPRADFTDIPFFLWFRENFTLPYIPAFNWRSPFFSTILAPAVFLFNYFAQLLEYIGLPRDSMLHTALVIPIGGICTVPFWIIPVALVHLNTPIFLFNLFVNLAIEPIVTFVRENLLGYSPMVHIRDIPAGGAG